jgi:hypothetical protein
MGKWANLQMGKSANGQVGELANRRVDEGRRVVGRHIAAVAASLPPEVVAAAQERGRARDLEAMEGWSLFLFYRLERPGRWICAVAKQLDGEGFLITTYPTDVIKEGKRVWSK